MSRVLKFKCRGHVDWRHKVQRICVPRMNAMNDLGFLGFFFHNAHLRLKRLYDAIGHQHLEGHVVIDQMGYGISFVPILGDNFIRIYHLFGNGSENDLIESFASVAAHDNQIHTFRLNIL